LTELDGWDSWDRTVISQTKISVISACIAKYIDSFEKQTFLPETLMQPVCQAFQEHLMESTDF
jgi:hypothetical protein